MVGVCSHVITLHRRGSGFVLRVDYARWGQTPEDLRHLALSAPHARTRERALALFDITQHRCATQVAGRTGRRAHTVMDWVHAYNQGGPETRAAPTRSRSAARAAAVPFLPAPRSRTRRGGLRRPAHGRDATPSRGRSSTTLDLAPPGRLGARALRAEVLSRDDPRGPAPPQAVVEESQEAAGPGQSGAQAGLCRATPGRAGRRSTRPASAGLRGRGPHPPGRGSRLRLGPARRASLGCLKLAGPVGAGLGLRAVSLQRGPGAAVALPARQRRPHDRGAATPARRVPR